ncbi:DUF2806 domain-containing protein [Pseudescherichia sp.]|uniref:DUF2806 domain-containing protein n=1 Tax=Pseudescherichia sp. TaxID=2055881 RepID=UPI0028A0A9B4|nr:DUF2806 domain-containing protein [Pseudescherichia sp.]
MSLIDFSFSGLSKPGEKLVGKVCDAVGILYEPTRIRRKAKAEADAKRTELVSKLQLEGIEKRAAERFLKRETKRQENIESITIQAAQNLNDEDSVSDIDEDWIEAFFKECEDVTDEQMQTLWARILSEEAKSNGSFSRRTLRLLSTLSREEAELITYFGKFVWQAIYLTPILVEDADGNIEGINFAQLAALDSMGIIQQSMGYSLTYNAKASRMDYYNIVMRVEFKSEDSKDWRIRTGTALLTPVGREIIAICGSTPDYEYLDKYLKKINTKESPVSITITEIK